MLHIIIKGEEQSHINRLPFLRVNTRYLSWIKLIGEISGCGLFGVQNLLHCSMINGEQQTLRRTMERRLAYNNSDQIIGMLICLGICVTIVTY